MAARITGSTLNGLFPDNSGQIATSGSNANANGESSGIGATSPPEPSVLDILRVSIISYGDVLSPIDEDDWESNP